MKRKAFQRAFSTAIAFKEHIVCQAPSMSNLVVVNVWSSGYYQIFPTDETGAPISYRIPGIIEEKVFVQTSTAEAIALIKAKDNLLRLADNRQFPKLKQLLHVENKADKKLLELKHRPHIGHASIQAGNMYLSIGADTNLAGIKLDQKYAITYSESYEEDVRGFKRPPEYRYPLFMLDAKSISEFIIQFIKDIKSGKRLYNLLGLRMLDFTEVTGINESSWYDFFNKLVIKPEKMGDSCSSSVALSLAAGGAFNHLNFEDRQLMKYGLISPTTIERITRNLMDYEMALCPKDIKVLQLKFREESDSEHKAIIKKIRRSFEKSTDNKPIPKAF